MANKDAWWRDSTGDEENRKFDKFAHAITTIDEEHRVLHDGMLFFINDFEQDIPDGDTRIVGFQTGAKPVHFKRLNISASEGPVVVQIAENATVDVQGTVVTPLNANRLSPNQPLSRLLASDTTYTDIGTPILGNMYLPANGNTGITGSTAALEEIIFLPNTVYTLSLTNDPAGAGTADVNATIVFYELDYPS